MVNPRKILKMNKERLSIYSCN